IPDGTRSRRRRRALSPPRPRGRPAHRRGARPGGRRPGPPSPSPRPSPRGWAYFGGTSDLDLDALFARLAEASRAALARAGDTAEVAGVAVAAVRFGPVGIARDARPL